MRVPRLLPGCLVSLVPGTNQSIGCRVSASPCERQASLIFKDTAVPKEKLVNQLNWSIFNKSDDNSPIAMLWGLPKLIGGRAPSGHRQSWWADGVPVMFSWRPGHVMLVSRSCFDGVPIMF